MLCSLLAAVCRAVDFFAFPFPGYTFLQTSWLLTFSYFWWEDFYQFISRISSYQCVLTKYFSFSSSSGLQSQLVSICCCKSQRSHVVSVKTCLTGASCGVCNSLRSSLCSSYSCAATRPRWPLHASRR